MTRDELNHEYFEWMYGLVCSNVRDYRKLLRYLHSVDFDYILPMDGNRAEDGTDLRYRFGYENRHGPHIISCYLDDRPCSVLEMMVALAIRCEDHIMDDPDIGNRTEDWFWAMIKSLGLIHMIDSRFKKEFVEDVISRFLNREYKRNGEGGLFTVRNCNRDMRSIEIWYQMCKYLDEII